MNAPPPPSMPPAAPADPARPWDWPTPAEIPPIGVDTATPVPTEVLTAPAPATAPPSPCEVVAAPVMVLLVAAPPPIANVEPACAMLAVRTSAETEIRSFFIWVPSMLPWLQELHQI